MSRKISRDPNQILRRKPNQFPISKITELNWGSCSRNTNTHDYEEKPDTDEGESDGIDADKLEYLRNRFNKPTCTCPAEPEVKD